MIMRRKKGQVFIIGVIVMIVLGLTTSFLMINFLTQNKIVIGEYESGMLDAINEGDKLIIYVEETAKNVVQDTLLQSADQGFVQLEQEDGETEPGPRCKTYGYNLWNNEDRECWPHADNGFGFMLDANMAKRFSELDDRNLHKDVTREYIFDSTFGSTRISAFTQENYEIAVFRAEEFKEAEQVQTYLDDKQKTALLQSGSFIWPIATTKTDVLSCFGYRGNVAKGASTNHGGIDIKASAGTPIVAVAAGKVISYSDSWGALKIDHGSGVQTLYGHTIKQYVKVGDTVTQGQHIADVGGRQYYINNARGAHLHFEVYSDNIDPRLKFKGIPAVITSGSTVKINPLCMYGPQYFEKNSIDLNVQSNTGCGSICSSSASSCADKTGVCDSRNLCIFKFCDTYGPLTAEQAICQTKDNKEWKITNVMTSASKISGEQTLKITTTVENPSVECASVAAQPIFSSSLEPRYVYDGHLQVDVYKDNAGKNYMNIEVECKFTTDASKLNTLRGQDKCVLLAPTDGSTLKYTIESNAMDLKHRNVQGPKTEFEVTKPVTTTINSQTTPQTPTQNPSISLNSDEQKKFDLTRKNLEKYNLIEYAREIAATEDVPSEILLGLITQESGGDINAGSVAGPKGLGQVMQSTYAGLKFENKCTWQEYQTDGKCQLRASASYLKDLYNMRQGKTYYYKCSLHCPTGPKGEYRKCSACTKNCIGPIDKKYEEWEAVLRGYNGGGWTDPDTIDGSGCTGFPDYEYVERVMKYAGAWGYTGAMTSQYTQVSKDEIVGKGLIGTYKINPSFTVDVPFDMNLVDNLSEFMNYTVNECRNSNLAHQDCLDQKIIEFNNMTGKTYKDKGIDIELTQDCDETKAQRAFYEFAQSVEDCSLSPDIDCQCDIKSSGIPKIKIASDEERAVLSFDEGGNIFEVISYHKILDSNDKPLETEMNTLKMFKKVGYLKNGTSNHPACTVPDSRFRMCLKTDYKIKDYNGNTMIDKNVTIRFAVTIKDNIAPPAIEYMELYNMPYAKNSVIVIFNESQLNAQRIADVSSYRIYLSDVATDFNEPMAKIRSTLKYRTLDVINSGYEKIQGFDISKPPACEIVDEQYCKFRYDAKDIDGNPVKIELAENKLYHMPDRSQFMYILSGDDQTNGLFTGRTKYIAVTAIDTDGNEIDNVDAAQRITQDKNLDYIDPADNMVPGFVKTVAYKDPLSSMITLTYNAPLYYINGRSMEKATIKYKVYADWTCSSGNFCSVMYPRDSKAESGALTMDISGAGMYRVGVVGAIGDSQYNQAYTVVMS